MSTRKKRKAPTEDEFLDKRLKDIKSECCNAAIVRKGRANYRCSKCDHDESMMVILITDMLCKEWERKYGTSTTGVSLSE